MPEGPLLLLYKEKLSPLVGLTIQEAATRLKSVDLAPLSGRTLTGIHTWGKYLFLLFDTEPRCYLRIHWGMFGIWYLDVPHPAKEPTATFYFESNRTLYLYSVSMRLLPGLPGDGEYDPRRDIMSPQWSTALAMQALSELPPDSQLCDALMGQTLFAGVGNAIKTEALYACALHPERTVASVPVDQLKTLVEETVAQSQLFLEERRNASAERYPWTLIYRRKLCPRCGEKIITAHTGVLQRKSHWCPRCQG